MSPRRSFWSLSQREVRGHAVVLAGVLWLGAAALILGTRGDLDLLGRLKGPDFVHFYSLGRAVIDGEPERLYDLERLYEFQVQLVPDSASERFQPVYAPQTALLFAVVAWMPYQAAMFVWALLTALAYAAVVRAAWRRWRDVLSDRLLVFAAAAGFPPFWNLILHGQTTMVPLLAFLGGWLALKRRRPFVAGLALSGLAIKPQFGVALAVVVLAAGEWAMLLGALTGVALQAGLVVLILGPGVFLDWTNVLLGLPQFAEALEPRPYQMHSLAALTRLIPGNAGLVAWLAVAGFILWGLVRVWRSVAPVAVKFAVVVMASVLLSPHLAVYDATVLALPLLLVGGWVDAVGDERTRARFWPVVYLLVLAFLVPVALLVRVQPSVFLQIWLFWLTVQLVRQQSHQSRPA